MAKQFSSCNWVPSRITETQLNGYVLTGALAKKEVIHWRVLVPKTLLNLKMEKWLCLCSIWTEGLALSDQKISGMYLPTSNSILKTLDQILCPTYATFKYSAKFTFKKNQLLSSLETFST